MAPITAFPNGVPSNALVMIPLGANGAPIEKQLVDGPMAAEPVGAPSSSRYREELDL